MAACLLLAFGVEPHAASAEAPPAVAPAAASSTAEAYSTGWDLYVEQDSVLAPHTDKDYTMGMAVNLSGWRLRRSGFVRVLFSKPLAALDKIPFWFVGKAHNSVCDDAPDEVAPECKLTPKWTRASQAHSLQIGVTAFTPRKGQPGVDPDCPHYGCVLADTNPVYHDRPYASLLYATYRRETARGPTAVHSDFMIGLFGLRIAQFVQAGIHDLQDPLTIPGGWHNQISDGIEPTVNYSFGAKRLVLPRADTKRNWPVDATIDGNVSLGMYTNASAGGRVRLGWISSPFWSADRQRIAPTRMPKTPEPPPGPAPPGASHNLMSESRDTPCRANCDDRARTGWIREAYLSGSAGYTAWGHNSLLSGQFLHSPVTLHFHPSPDDPNADTPMNRWIWDWQVGGTLRFKPFGIVYQYNRYKNLFEGPHKRDHAYWGLYLAFY